MAEKPAKQEELLWEPLLPAARERRRRREDMREDYAKALKQGVVPAAYVRLMFIGEGGSGKSSLLDGLMNNPFRDADSTALVDTRSVSYQWIQSVNAHDAWKPHSEKDEVMMLAAQSHEFMKGRMQSKQTSKVKLFDMAGKSLDHLKEVVSDSKFTEKASEIQASVFEEVISQALRQQHTKGPDVVLNIWDCGGQPVFLDIISAFLTSRTMFLLLFDASLNLDGMYKEMWRHGGKSFLGREQNVTRRQLMMQWMQLIYTSLVAKDEVSQYCQQSEASSARAILPECPKSMIIGTHGDKIKSEKAKSVLQSLKSTCDDASFSELILDMMIVDNTTAGRGVREDPGYKRIRENIHKFAQSLVIPTPIAWGAFRKAMQKAAATSPILTYGQSCIIAEQCGIPKDTVPSVLHFYHQLGAMMHYYTIPSLANTIIIEPKWLVEQLQKLLMPDWYQERPPHLARMWKWLEKRGVLVEEFYQEIWRDCGLEGGPQALADLLDHFDLAKKISQCPRDMQQYKGVKYFMPCMLKVQPHKKVSHQLGSNGEASTLHVVFNMGYVPPGFFVRVVARMTSNKSYIPLLDLEEVVYRDSITFQYNQIDRVSISESFESVSVSICRVSMRTRYNSRFVDSCVSLRSDLLSMCKEVLVWLPSIDFDLAFECNCSKEAPRHFALLEGDSHQHSQLFCKYGREFKLSSLHKCWLPSLQLSVPDSALTESEIENVSREVKDDVEVLAREMEMEYILEEAKKSRGPKQDIAHALITNFAEEGTRNRLVQHLRSANFHNTAQKLLKGKMQSPTSATKASELSSTRPHQPPFSQKEQCLIKKQDQPTLPLLIDFPASADGEGLNIMKEIGTHYNMFGVLLLNDKSGATISALERQHQSRATSINFEILQQWLQGSGEKPVTWETLVKVLRKIELHILADKIESSLS